MINCNLAKKLAFRKIMINLIIFASHIKYKIITFGVYMAQTLSNKKMKLKKRKNLMTQFA